MLKANNNPTRSKVVSDKSMAKERLSKLQKWILAKSLKDLVVGYGDVAEFFGKKYTDRKPEFIGGHHDLKKRYGENYKKEFNVEKVKQVYEGGYVWHGLKIGRKPELCFTNSEKAIASRSLKGLVKKGFLIQPRKGEVYRLTEGSFLKANNNDGADTFVSFKEYQKKIAEVEKGQGERRAKAIQELKVITQNIVKK